MTLSAFVLRLLFLALPGILASKLYKKLRGRPTREYWETFIEIALFSFASYAITYGIGFGRELGATELLVRLEPPFTVESQHPIRFAGPPQHEVSATQPVTVSKSSPNQHGTVNVVLRHPLTISSTQPVTIDGLPPNVFTPSTPVTIQPAPNAAGNRKSIFGTFLDERAPLDPHVGTITLAIMVATILAIAAAYAHNYSLVNRLGRLIRASKRSGDEDTWDFFNSSVDVVWVHVYDHTLDRVYYGLVKRYSDSEKPREMVLRDVQVFKISTDELLYCKDYVYLSRDHNNWTIEVPAPNAK